MEFSTEEKDRFYQRGAARPGIALYMYDPDGEEIAEIYEIYGREFYFGHFDEIQPFFKKHIYPRLSPAELGEVDILINRFSGGDFNPYVEWANSKCLNSFDHYTLDDLPSPNYNGKRINNPQELAALYGGEFSRDQRAEAEAFVLEQHGRPLIFNPYGIVCGNKLVGTPSGKGLRTNFLEYPFTKARWEEMAVKLNSNRSPLSKRDRKRIMERAKRRRLETLGQWR